MTRLVYKCPMRASSDSADLLTPEQVAQIFQVTKKTIYRWSQAGYLKPLRQTAGGKLRFRRDDVDALLAQDAS